MTYLRALSRISLVTLATALLAAACGDDAKAPVTTDTGSGDRQGNTNTVTGANNPAPGTGGGNGTTGNNGETPAGNISLNTPGRDPSLPINLAESGAVACGGGGDFCIAPNPTCCSAGGMGMGMGTFSCAPTPSDCPADTVSAAACANALGCSTGQVCCRSNDADGNGTTAACGTSCAAPAVQLCSDDAECGADRICNNNNQCGPAPCTATSCATGELCCRGQGGGQGAAPACVAVADGAQCPAGRRQVCADATTCPADNTCAPLGGGGGGLGGGQQALVCTPPPCTPTSCATGQACCVGGQVGGNPTCSTPDPTTALCPGNSRTVCITDAECAAVAGTSCLLNPQGGGSLSCRVPPPPPAADAGADGG